MTFSRPGSTLRSQNPVRPWSVTSSRLTRTILTLPPPPPPFLQTCSEVGEERDEFSPRRQINLPKEAYHFFFGDFYFIIMYYTMYIYTNLNIRAICGSAEQPLLGLDGKALSQPKPHPSNRTV